MCDETEGRAFLSGDAFHQSGESVPKFTDYRVEFGPKEFVRGRPAYRLAAGDRAIEVPAALRPQEAPVMIEARPIGANLEQEPIERLVLDVGVDLPLLLPQGA